jgi:hypothetical protein
LGHFDQRVLEFIKGIYIPAATGFDGGEEDGVALAAFDVIDGKPLFLPAAMGRERRGSLLADPPEGCDKKSYIITKDAGIKQIYNENTDK